MSRAILFAALASIGCRTAPTAAGSPSGADDMPLQATERAPLARAIRPDTLHTGLCGLDAEGRAVCWSGRETSPQPMADLNAQLGPADRFVRLRLYELSSVRWQPDVDVHTLCAMTEAGRIFCRGYRRGIDRALTQGLSVARTPADPVPEPPGAWVEAVDDAIDFDVGFGFGCAVRRDGRVVCWGSGAHGQLGPDHREGSRKAVPIAGVSDAVAVATSYRLACALRETGRVACWGDNPSDEDPRRAQPTEVPSIDAATDLAADDWGVCARLADGSARCWDSINHTVDDFEMLEPVEDVEEAAWIFTSASEACRWRAGELSCSGGEGPRVVELDRRRASKCVRLDDGSIECTGPQRRPPSMLDFVARPRSVSGLPDDVVEVDAGGWTSCVRTRSGDVWCWGYALTRELRSSDMFSAVARRDGLARAHGLSMHWPLSVDPLVFVDGGTQRLDIARADVEGLPTKDEVAGRGGRLCTRPIAGRYACISASVDDGECRDRPEHPMAVFGRTGPRALAIGQLHACAIDGAQRVWCLGYPGERLGVRERDPGCSMQPAPVAGVRDAVEVCAGMRHTCVRLRGGVVECWGDNALGQLGETGPSRAEARRVPGLPAATSVQCGGEHTCATTKGGEVWCWGLGAWGQRGDGDLGAAEAPRRVEGLPRVSGLAVGMDHACALASDRSVWCWGSNMFGQVGVVGSLEQPHRMPELSR